MAFDVYSVIRSEEVREHARKYWDLEPEDKVLLIHFSFLPVEKRYEFLKVYSESLEDGDSKRYAEDFVKAYRMVIDHIYHPKERVLYLCEMARPSEMAYRTKKEEVQSVLYVRDYTLQGWYDSLEELIESEVTPYEPMEPGYLFSVYQVSVPASGKSDDKVRFYMELIDGKNEISGFYVDDDWLRENGICDAVIEDLFIGGCGGRHSYPFANFGSVLLQIPLMKKPLKCTINSDLDGNYCWYQWLYPRLPKIPEYPGWNYLYGMDEGWNLDMSYWQANLNDHYSTFDWIRSDPEANDCFPGDFERIRRSWENIQHMTYWRNEGPEDYDTVSKVSCRLWPSHMEEETIEGNTVKTLWLMLKENPDGELSEGQASTVSIAELLRIAGQKTVAFEDAIMRICQVQCKVRIEV